MIKKTPEQIAIQIMEFYNQYDLKISGKINNQTAYELIKTLEETYPIDTIQLSDGTRIWNLLRVFLYSHFQKPDDNAIKKKLSIHNIKSILSVFKEGFVPLNLPKDTTVCGFSSSESRKLYHNTYYDIYLDPLYDILENKLAVFEWPETTGYRRKYEYPVFSRQYVTMHFPVWSNTFWRLLVHRFTGHKHYIIESEDVLRDIIRDISTTSSVNESSLVKDVFDFITVFVIIKDFFNSILKKIKPKAVLIRCGYGRFPMALSQACRKLNIPSIELQHGLITAYLPAYRRTTSTTNKDCVPEYLLTQGEIYTSLVRDGHLFDRDKVFSTGFPYLQQALNERRIPPDQRQSLSLFPHNILFTSQWIVADKIQEFIINVATLLERSHLDVGILLKPHPYDQNNYEALKNHKHIVLISKYEDIYKLFISTDIHATVYSTSGLEAMAFGTPNIFVDLFNMVHGDASPYIVSSPAQFIDSIRTILSHYQECVNETRETAHLFFTPSPMDHIRKFFTDIGIM